ncbi:hypothetical protein CY34DRAFT_792418 [Suillus luteus UH-Slu-Lm8-n1]|uniref:Unplaced genomic scaffold CY34scaffold_906, whole genome shotgun sequence n=1 Tax=Suillus luteus UH-Slu-Lm8-n1 TaxID=930992 RepID=A0A0D0AFS1_9AGAM|nr:hypothetical protein CY34DRAFT_792418 [Suillus luteus UH-Slu-Lm8-n1]
MAEHNTIKLMLPASVKSFKFTFECRKPGPMAIDISMREPFDSELPSSAVYGFDPSEMSTTKPGNLTNWLANQTAQRNSFLAQVAKAAPQVIDSCSVTEPESEPPHDDPAKCAGPVLDNSETESESEPEAATPPDFTIWYEANKHDLGVALLSWKRSETDPGQIGLRIHMGSGVPNASSASRFGRHHNASGVMPASPASTSWPGTPPLNTLSTPLQLTPQFCSQPTTPSTARLMPTTSTPDNLHLRQLCRPSTAQFTEIRC